MKKRLCASLVLVVFLSVFLQFVAMSTAGAAACTHRWVVSSNRNPTCTASGRRVERCSKCGTTRTITIGALGHANSTTTTNATCTANGSRTTRCSRCGSTSTTSIPKLGHAYESRYAGGLMDTQTNQQTCGSYPNTTHTHYRLRYHQYSVTECSRSGCNYYSEGSSYFVYGSWTCDYPW